MKIKDRIYGQIEIKEPVLIELINSKTLQRLKGVEQAGYFKPFCKYIVGNRFDHSIGVMLLLKKYQAPLEEQVAGLLHDASHAAFSHAIDYVFKDGSEKNHTHQDNIHNQFLLNSKIPKILKKYQLDINYILEDKNFLLKENNIPALCADRIDYSLRDAINYKTTTKKIINHILSNLIVKNNKWIFNNFSTAQIFADNFYYINKKYYAGLITAIMFKTLSDCLKYALKKKYININDLYTTDKQVIKKVNKYADQDKELKFYLSRLNNKIKAKNNPKNYDSIIYCKSRIVDPLCMDRGEIKKVSDINPKWKKVVKEELKPKKYYLKFEK